MFCVSSPRYHGSICGLLVWHSLVILTCYCFYSQPVKLLLHFKRIDSFQHKKYTFQYSNLGRSPLGGLLGVHILIKHVFCIWSSIFFICSFMLGSSFRVPQRERERERERDWGYLPYVISFFGASLSFQPYRDVHDLLSYMYQLLGHVWDLPILQCNHYFDRNWLISYLYLYKSQWQGWGSNSRPNYCSPKKSDCLKHSMLSHVQ